MIIQPVAAAVIDAGRVTPVALTVMDIPVVFTMTAGVFVNALVKVILCAVVVVFSYPLAYSITSLRAEPCIGCDQTIEPALVPVRVFCVVFGFKLETVGEPEGLICSCPRELKVRVALSMEGMELSLVRLPIQATYMGEPVPLTK